MCTSYIAQHYSVKIRVSIIGQHLVTFYENLTLYAYHLEEIVAGF